jgi:dTDP-4-dehydrorhamnose reductase
MKKILATGAVGLVGSRFLEMFKDKYEVANMDILSGVDITDKASVEKFVSANPSDVMIHLAAFTDTNKAWEEKGNTEGICYKVNVVGTKNLAEVCASHGIHLIHISTDYVFDGTKDGAYVEDDATAPLEWYGETKAIAEAVVKDSGVSYTIVRIAYPYRANFEKKPDLIKKIRAGLESGKLYPQFSDTIITPTLIDDIAHAFDKIIELKPQGIYHVTGSTALSPFELAQKVAVAYGFGKDVVKEGSLTEYLKTASRPFARKVAMDNSKAAKDLGLTFATVDEGLAEIKKQQEL